MRKFETIRTEIKKLSEEQKLLKPQRKETFKGKRTVDNPLRLIDQNRYELRHLFQAYAILKGIERQPVTKKEMSESKVKALIEKYKVE
jgi:hypothetical protein